MISSVAVYLLLHRLVLHREKTVFEEKFHVPLRNDIDRPLVLGAALFGIGWGTSGPVSWTCAGGTGNRAD